MNRLTKIKPDPRKSSKHLGGNYSFNKRKIERLKEENFILTVLLTFSSLLIILLSCR